MTPYLTADQLRQTLNDGNFKPTFSYNDALHATARIAGFANWNTLFSTSKEVDRFRSTAKEFRAALKKSGISIPLSQEAAQTFLPIAQAIFSGTKIQPESKASPLPVSPKSKASKPTMDELMKFLDQERVNIANLILEQKPGWLESSAKKRESEFRDRMNSICGQAEKRFDVPDHLKAKNKAVIQALRNTVIPPMRIPHVDATASGIWHETVRVSRADGEPRRVDLGMADYVMTLNGHRLLLDAHAFLDELQLASTERKESAARFIEWLKFVDPGKCGSAVGKSWVTDEWNVSKRLYWFCFPEIKEVSMVIKKLRKFTERLPTGSVYVCSPDQHALGILFKQGVGGLHYPTGETSYWTTKKQRVMPEELRYRDYKNDCPWTRGMQLETFELPVR